MKASLHPYALLVLLFILSFAYWIGGAASVYDDLRFGAQHARLPFEFGLRMQTISGDTPEARAAGAQIGDTLLQFDGRPFSSVGVMRRAVRHARPGSLIPAVIERQDKTDVPIVIRLAAERTAPAPISEWLRDFAIQLFFPLFCLALGFWVAVARPFDGNAWLLLALMISLEFLVPLGNSPEPWQILRAVWLALANYSWPAWMMLFGIYFPERSVIDRRLPWAKWLVVAILAFSAIPIVVAHAAMEVSFASVAWLRPALSKIELVNQIVGMIAISLFFVHMGAKSGTASTKDAARRIRYVWLGATVGLTPGFIVTVVSLAKGTGFGAALPAWLVYFSLGCLAIFPLTLAYVILVQRAMDVRMAIRQSVRYTLA